jgi:hypothetical protein
MFLTEQFIEKLFYFLERPLGTARVHEWRENYKLVLVWEHQGVRLGLLVNLRDRSITTRLATEGVLGRGRGGLSHLCDRAKGRTKPPPYRLGSGQQGPNRPSSAGAGRDEA